MTDSAPTATGTAPAAATAVDLYLDMMAKMLTRYGFEGRNVTVKFNARSYEGYLWNLVRTATRDRDIRVVEAGEFDGSAREVGRTGRPTPRPWSG